MRPPVVLPGTEVAWTKAALSIMNSGDVAYSKLYTEGPGRAPVPDRTAVVSVTDVAAPVTTVDEEDGSALAVEAPAAPSVKARTTNVTIASCAPRRELGANLDTLST